MKKGLRTGSVLLACMTFLSQQGAFAQEAAAQTKVVAGKMPDFFFEPLFYLAMFVGVVVVLSFYAMLRAIHALTAKLTPQKGHAVEMPAEQKVSKPSAFNRLMDSLTRSVPVAKEKDIMLDHNYDGIRELDNQLPPWWKWGFYITIIFAVVYLMYYHVSGAGKLMAAEYNAEMNQAALEKEIRMKDAKNNVTEANVSLLTTAQELEEGNNIFHTNCTTCHGVHAQGTETAPNLTDAYWLHGGGIKNVFRTVTTGVPGKAMISWAQKLSPRQINEVASYVLSLQGSMPEGAKQPEGELYKEESAPAAQADTNANNQKRVN